MRGEHAHKTQDVGPRLKLARPPRRPEKGKFHKRPEDGAERRRFLAEKRTVRSKARKAEQTRIYRKRRVAVAGLVLIGIMALVFAILAPTAASDAQGRAVPIDPANAGPGTVLSEVGGIGISTPVRPSALTGLGYHSEGEGLAEMEPRGRNLSTNPLFALFIGGSTPEEIRYYIMDPVGRGGPRTGALDAGAVAGTTVYAPVTGTITSIRPDPSVQNANLIEIQPSENPDLRVTVSLVESREGSAGVKSPVDAGKTGLGVVADSAQVLDPQLSGYTGEAGNHVTITVANVG